MGDGGLVLPTVGGTDFVNSGKGCVVLLLFSTLFTAHTHSLVLPAVGGTDFVNFGMGCVITLEERYSVYWLYWLYWYKSTRTDAARTAGLM